MPSLYIPIYGARESHGWEFAQATVFDTFEEASEYVTDRGDRDDGFPFLGIQVHDGRGNDRLMSAREFEDQRKAMELEREMERQEDARLNAVLAGAVTDLGPITGPRLPDYSPERVEELRLKYRRR